MIGALVSAGASLIGGLFGMSSAKKRDKENAARVAAANAANERATQLHNAQNRRDVARMNLSQKIRAERAAKVPIVTTGSVDVDGMMAAAEKAGFNPVTWLQNGGMAAYAKTSTTGTHAMDAALAGSYLPSPALFQQGMPALSTAPGVGEVIGSALTAGASQWNADYSQAQQNSFQRDLLMMQLKGSQRDGSDRGSAPSRSGYVPSMFSAGSMTTSGNSAALGLGRGTGALRFMGQTITPDPAFSDAQLAEDRYGDFGGSVWGAGVMAADVYRWANTVDPTAVDAAAVDWLKENVKIGFKPGGWSEKVYKYVTSPGFRNAPMIPIPNPIRGWGNYVPDYYGSY